MKARVCLAKTEIVNFDSVMQMEVLILFIYTFIYLFPYTFVI